MSLQDTPPAALFFLSHSSRDKALVEQIAEGLLERHGIHCWIDIWAIPAAADWHAEIHKALESCTGALVVLGPNGWGPYHLSEARIAVTRRATHPGFVVVPVLLAGAQSTDVQQLEELFRASQWVEFGIGDGDQESEALQRIATALGAEAPFPLGRPRMSPFTIRRDARRWHESKSRGKPDRSILYRGRTLSEAQRIARESPGQMDSAALELLQDSDLSERTRLRRQLFLAAGFALVLTALTALAYVLKNRADDNAVRANAERRQALASALAAEAARRLDGDPSALPSAMHLALESDRLRPDSAGRLLLLRGLDLLPSPEWKSTVAQSDNVSGLTVSDGDALILRSTGSIERVSRKSSTAAETIWRPVAAADRDALMVASANASYVARLEQTRTATLIHSTSRRQWHFPLVGDAPVAAALNHDGRWLITVDSRRMARIYRSDAGRQTKPALNLAALTHDDLSIGGLALDPSGTAAAFYSERTDKGGHAVWWVRWGTPPRVLRLPQDDFVQAVAFAPDGRLAIASGSDVQIRDLEGTRSPVRVRAGRTAASLSLTFSHDGALLASHSLLPLVQVWNATDGRELARINPEGLIRGVAFSPDGDGIVTASERVDSAALDIQGWRLPDAAAFRRARTRYPGGTAAVRLTPDGESALLPAPGWQGLSVIDLRTGRSRIPLREPIEAFSVANESLILTRHERRLIRRRWPDLSIESESLLPGRPDATSANGERAVVKEVAGDFSKGSAVTTLTVWSTTPAAVLSRYVVGGLVNRLEFSSNGRWLVAALLKAPADIQPRTDAVLIIDTAATDKAVREVHYGANPVRFAFSRDGSRLAAAGSSGTVVLNLQDLAVVKTFSETDSDTVALSADGRYVATADRDTFVRVHDLQGEKQPRLFAYTVGAFGDASLQFTPDAKTLVAGFVGSDAVWVWPLDHSALIKSLCGRIGSELTNSEWQTHLPGELYTPVCASLR